MWCVMAGMENGLESVVFFFPLEMDQWWFSTVQRDRKNVDKVQSLSTLS